MISIAKVVVVLSSGFLLYLGLSNAAQAHTEALAADELKVDQAGRKQGGQKEGKQQMNEMKGSQPSGGKTITGEVLRVEGNNCFVKGQDGKEVRLHIDLTTLKAKNIEPGDRIEAKVNDQNHALSVPSGQAVQVYQRRAVGQ